MCFVVRLVGGGQGYWVVKLLKGGGRGRGWPMHVYQASREQPTAWLDARVLFIALYL